MENLSHREKEVLKYVVENFIKSALPVGSRSVSKQTDLNLSSATIRNVMSDLEELDLLSTPHTSAGRIPTDKGLRFYVNSLMNRHDLKNSEMEMIKNSFDEMKPGYFEEENLYIETSRILSKISHQLSIVTKPFLSSGVFEKIDMMQVSSNRVLVILNIKSGYVKTVIMEIEGEITRTRLESIARILNERLSGLTLKEIKETYSERLHSIKNDEPELVQLFINSLDKMHSEEEKGGTIHIGGTGEIINQPEFEDPKSFRNIIHIAENKNLVLHIFQPIEGGVNISIGKENQEQKLKDYSVIYSSYKIGDMTGNIGIIGPKRINYGKMVSLIQYISNLISESYS